jgi:hypothetical protein
MNGLPTKAEALSLFLIELRRSAMSPLITLLPFHLSLRRHTGHSLGVSILVHDEVLHYFLPCYRSDSIPSLSVTMLCRLMLNLYQAGGLGMDTAEPNTIDLESIQFVVPTTAMTDHEDERL